MTVRDLIRHLSTMPQDATILSPCCVGPYSGHPIIGPAILDDDQSVVVLEADEATDIDLEV